MKYLAIAFVVATAITLATPTIAAPIIIVSPGNSTAIGLNNDFRLVAGGLTALQLTRVSNDRTLTLSGPARLTFAFLGSESGYRNRFTSGTVVYNEVDANRFLMPLLFGTPYVAGSGSYAPLFSTPGIMGTTAPGNRGFGIFLPASVGIGEYRTSSLLVGYDDPTAHPDRDFDDLVVRIDATAVPEPGVWAMLIAGFGLVGIALRRQPRRTSSVLA